MRAEDQLVIVARVQEIFTTAARMETPSINFQRFYESSKLQSVILWFQPVMYHTIMMENGKSRVTP